MERGICFRVLTGQGANIDTTTASGRLVFGIFALAGFGRELIREKTIAGFLRRLPVSQRPCLYDDAGQAPFAQTVMAKHDKKVSDPCTELGATRQTLSRFVRRPQGGVASRRHEAVQAQGAEPHLMKENGTNNRALINRQTWSESDPKRRPTLQLRPSTMRAVARSPLVP
jgi:hypothetical protein